MQPRTIKVLTILALHASVLICPCRSGAVNNTVSFRAFARRALKTIARNGWGAIRRLGRGRIELCQYTRVYRSYWSDPQWKEFESRQYLITPSQFTEDAELNTVSSILLDVDKPLPQKAGRSLAEFKHMVNFLLSSRPDAIRTGLHVASTEVSALDGPAVTAKNVSNVEWRIEFINNHGRWYVHRLVVASH